MKAATGWRAALTGAVMLAGSLCAQEGMPAPAPGQEKLPVVFWAHYMAVVGTGSLGGGNDSYPFVSAEGPSADQYVRHIREAQKSGINGFQMLMWADPAAYAAARRVKQEGGELFYLNPQWCDFGDNVEKAVSSIAAFTKEHQDDPHVFRVNGKQVHFFYNQGSWAGGKTWTDSPDLAGVKAKLRERGAEVLLIPSSGHTTVEKIVLDREDLGHGEWPQFQPPAPGKPQWLEQTAWDGLDGFTHTPINEDVARLITQRLKPFGDRFLFVPSVSMGYDSSNRPAQAIHCPQNGIRTLREGLRAWVGQGFRQIVAITWNDLNEAMLLPSSRSPYGFADIMKYYRGLAENGQSPFAEPHAVVSYDSEALYGDELLLQFLLLPERGGSDSEYVAQIRLENVAGALVSQQTARVRTRGEREDAFAELRVDTRPFLGREEILSPVVSVLRVDPISAQRQVVLSPRRLAPIHLRYNLLHFYTPYAISLNHVDPDATLELAIAGKSGAAQAGEFRTGEFVPLRCAVKGSVPLRKLHLAESRISCGSFRADDTAASIGQGRTRQYVRLRVTHNGKVTVSLPGGMIEERFARSYQSERMLMAVGADTYATRFLPFAPNPGRPGLADGWTSPVLRLCAAPGATLQLQVTEPVQATFTTTIAALAAGPTLFTAPLPAEAAASAGTGADADGKSKEPVFALRVELAVGAQEPNFDFPLPAEGTYQRDLPLDQYNEPALYFHVWSLNERDQVAYSRPVRTLRQPAPGQPAAVSALDSRVNAPLIHTLGTFDDFVDAHSSATRNFFTAADLVEDTLPAYAVPYYLLTMDEGAGDSLNCGGHAIQLGNAWLTGAYRWIADGWRGKAVELEGGRIQVRAKSFPHGAYTFSARIRVGSPVAAAAQTVVSDGDFWMGLQTQALWLQIQPDGRVKARRSVREVKSEVVSRSPLAQGWNHIVAVCDLRTVRLYLNGKLEAEAALATPAYQRTHCAPQLGFDKSAPRGEPAAAFTGAIDQVELIGAPLTEQEVGRLYTAGQWRAR